MKTLAIGLVLWALPFAALIAWRGWGSLYVHEYLFFTQAALVTTWATFLPSFLFILLGAPYIELPRGARNLNSALSGITAAVVGVILNLALVFGVAVIWPRGLAGEMNWFAVITSIAALVALYRFKADVLWVVIGGGLIGLARALLSG